MRPFQDPRVARAFEAYPAAIKRRLLRLRELIFETAEKTPGVGRVEETLKWGEPGYVTSETGSGSTIRIGWKRDHPHRYAMYFHCQTNLVGTFRKLFPHEFEFEGNRALVFDKDRVPVRSLAACIASSLTYHLRKKKKRRSAFRFR